MEINKTNRRPMSKNKLISRILIIAGIAMLLAAGGLFAYNEIFDYQAGVRARELLDQMMDEVDWELPPLSGMTSSAFSVSGDMLRQDNSAPDNVAPDNAAQDIVAPPDAGSYLFDLEPPGYNGPGRVLPRTDGESDQGTSGGSSGGSNAPSYSTLGIISIPKLGVRLPVLSDWSSSLLNISCCRISGLVLSKPVRLVIAGHNINSHFKGLDTFVPGDGIAFTTKDGVTRFYEATEISTLHKSDVAEVLAADGWDITLLTCKKDNTYRTMARFVEIASEIPAEISEESTAETTIDDAAEAAEAPADGAAELMAETPGAEPSELAEETPIDDAAGAADETPGDEPETLEGSNIQDDRG